jgi:thiol-disulfide isomerase/thioredoxin
MEPAPLPPQPRSALRRYLPLTVAGLIVVGFAIALIISISGGSSKTSSDVTKLDPNAQQPPELADTNDVTGTRLPKLAYVAFDGSTKELAPNGKPLLINVWSSTCVPCVTEMPALEKVWQANLNDIDILGLDYLEPPELGQAMADRTGVTYPLGRDVRGSILRSLGGTGLPYTVLVASNGTILATHSGALTAEQFTEFVKTATGN